MNVWETIQHLDQAVGELAQRIHDLEAALRALVDVRPIMSGPDIDSPDLCAHCLGAGDDQHEPDCPWGKARALLERKGEGE